LIVLSIHTNNIIYDLLLNAFVYFFLVAFN